MLEFFITYIAVMGTWEIAQATVARGTISNVLGNNESEKNYKPLSAVNPLNVIKMCTWWTEWESDEHGTEDLIILKKRFSWGLRYLIASIVLNYLLGRLKFLFL